MCDKEIGNSEKNIVYGVDCDSLLREALDLGEQEAFQKFLEVISLYPDCDYAYYQIALYYKKYGCCKDAIKYLSKAVELQPENDYGFAELGYCYEVLNKLKKAERYYQIALNLNSDNPITMYYWADYLISKKKGFQSAEVVIKELVFRYPEVANWHRLYADTLSELGKTQDANEEYRKAVELAPEDCIILNNYGAFLLNNGESDVAKKYLKQAIEINPSEKLYKDNLYLATKASTRYYKFKFKYLNKLFGPILDKPKLVFFIIAIWFPLSMHILKFSVKHFEHTNHILIYKAVIIVTILLLLFLLVDAIAEFITWFLIKTKLIK